MEKKTIALGLSLLGVVGTGVTAYLTYKGAMKNIPVLTVIDIYESKVDTKLELKDKIKRLTPAYIPAAVSGVVTAGLIFASFTMSKKAILAAGTISSASALYNNKRFEKYKKQVIDKLGGESHKTVIKGMAEDEMTDNIKKKYKTYRELGMELYFEEHIGYFLADPTKFAFAYSHLNQKLHDVKTTEKYQYTALLSDLLEMSDAEVLNKLYDSAFDPARMGWDLRYLEDQFGSNWINFDTYEEELADDDIPFTVIQFMEKPTNIDELKITEDYCGE